MHTFETLNIVLTRTPTRTPTDADANDWVTTKAFQGYSSGELKRKQIIFDLSQNSPISYSCEGNTKKYNIPSSLTFRAYQYVSACQTLLFNANVFFFSHLEP